MHRKGEPLGCCHIGVGRRGCIALFDREMSETFDDKEDMYPVAHPRDLRMRVCDFIILLSDVEILNVGLDGGGIFRHVGVVRVSTTVVDDGREGRWGAGGGLLLCFVILSRILKIRNAIACQGQVPKLASGL